MDVHEPGPGSGGDDRADARPDAPPPTDLSGPGVEPLPPQAGTTPPAAPPAAPRAETPPDEQIMAKLPRSRPGRQTARRTPARGRAAKPRVATGRARTGAGAPAPRARRSTAKPRPDTVGPTEPNETDPGVFGPREAAPGLPRLALDGAIEAAKMPVKVGANVTFRALDALIKGLRRQ